MITILIIIAALLVFIFIGLIYIISSNNITTEQLSKQLELKIAELNDLVGYRKGLENDLNEYRKKQDIDILAVELKEYHKKIKWDIDVLAVELKIYHEKIKGDVDILAAELNTYHTNIKEDVDLLAAELKEYRELIAKDLQEYRKKK